MEKLGPDGPKWGQEDLFPTNPDLADILGDTDSDFESFHFWILFDPKFPDFQVPDFKIFRFPGSQISKFPDFQTPAAPDKLSDPNLTPLPTHPGMKYFRKENPRCR